MILTHQGRLLDAAGQPANGIFAITYSIWDDPSAGQMLWSETQDVEIRDGLFHVLLGQLSPPPDDNMFSLPAVQLWLQIQIGTDIPLSPRQRLTSVPYAIDAAGLTGNVLTAPGSLKVVDPDQDPVPIELTTLGLSSVMSITNEGRDRLRLGSSPEGSSHVFLWNASGDLGAALNTDDDGTTFQMVDSFFDITYRIEFAINDSGAQQFMMANQGELSSMIADKATPYAVNTALIHKPAVNDCTMVELATDDDGSSATMTGSFFDIFTEISLDANDSSAESSMKASQPGGPTSTKIDKTTPLLAKALCQFVPAVNDCTMIEMKSDASGSSARAIDSFFDVFTRVEMDANDGGSQLMTEAEELDGPKSMTKDMSSPTQATSVWQHVPAVNDCMQVEINTDGSSSGMKMQSSFFDIFTELSLDTDGSSAQSSMKAVAPDGSSSNKTDNTTPISAKSLWSVLHPVPDDCSWVEIVAGISQSEVAAYGPTSPTNPGGSAGLSSGIGGSNAWMVDSFFDITYRVDLGATELGSGLGLSSLLADGSSSGISLKTDPMSSLIAIDEGGVHKVALSSNLGGGGGRLAIGDLNGDGMLDLVAGSGGGGGGGGKIVVTNLSPMGGDEVKITAGDPGGPGVGGRIALSRTIPGQIPIEMISLELTSVGPSLSLRTPNSDPAMPPRCQYYYDGLDRLVRAMRPGPLESGDSTVDMSNGMTIYSGPLQFSYSDRGIMFSSPTGSPFMLTPDGSMMLQNGASLALNVGSMVGIGTNGPTEKLFVDGNICATGLIGPCSDARYKRNVSTIDNALEKISKLRGVGFDWNTDDFRDRHFSDDHQIGLIAQELLEIVPEVVTKGTDGFYSVDYGRLTPLLIEAIKEQQKIIQTQNEEIGQLQAKYSELDDKLNLLLEQKSPAKVKYSSAEK
jgi:hypothetical protein